MKGPEQPSSAKAANSSSAAQSFDFISQPPNATHTLQRCALLAQAITERAIASRQDKNGWLRWRELLGRPPILLRANARARLDREALGLDFKKGRNVDGR